MEEGFQIGSHTKTHLFCNQLDYSAFEKEVIGSIEDLYKLTGVMTPFYSYPFGVRALQEHENLLIEKFNHKLQTMLGTKNKLFNSDNPNQWERDKLESNFYYSLFRFHIIPLIRKVFF